MSNFPPYDRHTNLKHVATRQSNNTAPLTGKLADVQSRVTQAYREAAAALVLVNALTHIAKHPNTSDKNSEIAQQALDAYHQAISNG